MERISLVEDYITFAIVLSCVQLNKSIFNAFCNASFIHLRVLSQVRKTSFAPQILVFVKLPVLRTIS